MTVLPPPIPHASSADDDSMGQAKSRLVDVLCPGPAGGGGHDSRSPDSFDVYQEEDEDEVDLAASCCRLSGGGGGPRGGYSPAAGDDVGLADTQMVVLRDRQTSAGETGRATRLITIAPPRLRVAHASVDSDCGDSEVLFSREIQILRHQCGHHRVR